MLLIQLDTKYYWCLTREHNTGLWPYSFDGYILSNAALAYSI
jgi:hypothetical protein